ncbi:hypothetical protein EDD22DRAFT_955334 [Suillus occidentalis]|nr:hypothetical protein EDD22DRAFT_955334 [Suillus occidentalis]
MPQTSRHFTPLSLVLEWCPQFILPPPSFMPQCNDRLFHGADWIASFMLQHLPCRSPLSWCKPDCLFHAATPPMQIASFILQRLPCRSPLSWRKPDRLFHAANIHWCLKGTLNSSSLLPLSILPSGFTTLASPHAHHLDALTCY